MQNNTEKLLTGKQLQQIFDSFGNPRDRTLINLRKRLVSACGMTDCTLRNYTKERCSMPKLVSEKITEILKNEYPEKSELLNQFQEEA